MKTNPKLTESHTSQFGFKSNSSTLHAEYLISETIKLYTKHNSPIYMCSLDAEKAFDSCNWNVLFEKLYYEKQIPLNIVNVISSLYKSGSASISYLGCTSEKFSLSQGVRQGSILSPHLYNIYTEKLLEEITSNTVVGTSINEIYTGIVAYADDVILMSTTLSGLQRLVNKCNSYGTENYIKLNPEKTEFLASGKAHNQRSVIYICNSMINLKTNLKHLGFIWDTNNKHIATLNNEHIRERITQCRTVANTLISSGIRYCHPNTIIQLFNSLLIPKLTYGLELCNLSNKTIDNLNVTGRTILKSLFNISKHSRNYLQTLFNINPISTEIIKNKLNLFVRLLNNIKTSEIIYSQLVNGTNKLSLVFEVREICNNNNINFYDLLVYSRKIYTYTSFQEIPENIENSLTTSFELWHLEEQRKIFRDIMEENIPRKE